MVAAPLFDPNVAGAQPAVDLQARRYLHLLYGRHTTGYLNLCTFDGSPIEWFSVDDIETIAQRAITLAPTHNVYHSIAPRSEAYYRSLTAEARAKERGGSNHVVALPGFWLDVDLLDPVHKKTNLPPTARDALDLIAEFPLKPTLVNHSGHGFQPWWLFQDPCSLENDKERARAQALLDRFHSVMLVKARDHGWTLDNTRDLARVFRVAGTVNRKDPANPVAVEILFRDETRRYRPEDFEPYLVGAEATATHTNGRTPKAVAFESPSSYLSDDELLKRAISARNGEKFARLWIGDLTDYGDDDSAADLGLGDMLAFWTNRDPARMDRLFRRSGLYRPKWDEVHYADGETHGEHTIAKAIAGVAQGHTGIYIVPLDDNESGDCDGSDSEAGPCADLVAEIEYLRVELARTRSENATLRRMHSAQWRVFANPKLKGVGLTAAKRWHRADRGDRAPGRDVFAPSQRSRPGRGHRSGQGRPQHRPRSSEARVPGEPPRDHRRQLAHDRR